MVRVGANVECTLTPGSGVTIRVGGGSTGAYAGTPASVRRISVSNNGTVTSCDLSDGSNQSSAGEPAMLDPGTVGILTNQFATVRLQAIVLYGAK